VRAWVLWILLLLLPGVGDLYSVGEDCLGASTSAFWCGASILLLFVSASSEVRALRIAGRAASEIVDATREGTAAARLVRNELPALRSSFAEAFEGPVRIRAFRAGERIHRSPWVPKELADRPGVWFGTRRTVTRAGTESQYNVRKWGNPLEVLRTFEFTQDVTVYYGRVAGGKGYQVLIPQDVNPGEVLRFIEEVTLR